MGLPIRAKCQGSCYRSCFVAILFFSEEERQLVDCLAHLILPPNEAGNITEAGVVPFIEFMMVDYPPFQLPMRGLMALNAKGQPKLWKSVYCKYRGRTKKPTRHHGLPSRGSRGTTPRGTVLFLLRNLVLTGYFTSAVGIKELIIAGIHPMFGTVSPKKYSMTWAWPMTPSGSPNVSIKKKKRNCRLGRGREFADLKHSE